MDSSKRPVEAPMSLLQQRFGFVLNRTARVLQSTVGAQLKALGLTGPQLALLQFIVENPGSSLAEVSARTGADPATLTELARRMQKRGLIRRERDPQDGRRMLLFIDDLDEGVMGQARQAALEVDEQAMRGMTVKERQQLLALLRKVADNLS